MLGYKIVKFGAEEKKPMSKSTKIFIGLSIAASIYTIAILIIFIITGSEPSTLTVSFFSALLGADGITGFLTGIRKKAENALILKGCDPNGNSGN